MSLVVARALKTQPGHRAELEVSTTKSDGRLHTSNAKTHFERHHGKKMAEAFWNDTREASDDAATVNVIARAVTERWSIYDFVLATSNTPAPPRKWMLRVVRRLLDAVADAADASANVPPPKKARQTTLDNSIYDKNDAKSQLWLVRQRRALAVLVRPVDDALCVVVTLSVAMALTVARNALALRIADDEALRHLLKIAGLQAQKHEIPNARNVASVRG